MESIADKIAKFAKALGKNATEDPSSFDYQQARKDYERQANEDILALQQSTRKQRVEKLLGRSELNPKWTFSNLVEDSEDVVTAISIAKSFIAAHEDPEWRSTGCHLMLFYGDYGRGKSHIAGAMAHQLIQQYEVSVLYRQLSTLLELRHYSFEYSADDNVGGKYRALYQELLDVDLLILDEVCVNETVLKKNTQSWLGNLLRQRLVNKKNCILITNHNLSDLEVALGSYCYESIKEYDTYKVRFSGPSRRESMLDEQVERTTSQQYQPNQVP